MKFTNKFNLPQHICDWLAFDEYDYNPDTISATTIIGPARAKRCNYCTAAPFCEQYNQLKAAGLVDGD